MKPGDLVFVACGTRQAPRFIAGEILRSWTAQDGTRRVEVRPDGRFRSGLTFDARQCLPIECFESLDSHERPTAAAPLNSMAGAGSGRL